MSEFLEWFPATPRAQPDELGWAHLKATLANGRTDNLDQLLTSLSRITRALRKRPDLIRAFVTGSELPSFLRLYRNNIADAPTIPP